MERWVGKTAVVTGASAGIGAAVCVALASAGLTVVGLARRPQLVDELASQVQGAGAGSIRSHACDVGRAGDVAAAFQWVEHQLGGVHVLVNNAGIIATGHITNLGSHQLTEEQISSIIDVNLKGVIRCSRRAIASMQERHFDGHIININSIAGHYTPLSPLFNVYPASKHAVTAFTDSLVNELAHLNSSIKVTSLSPGLVATNMTETDLHLVDFKPLEPKDVADAVVYAVSTPPNVNITELTIRPVQEKRL